MNILPTYHQSVLQTVAYRTIRNRVNKVLAGYDLNTTQWSILGLVHENPSQLRITDLADRLAVKGTLITVLVRSLTKSNYITTTPSATDRRAVSLSITTSGEQLINELEQKLADHLQSLTSGLSDADMATYFRCLQAFIDNSKQ